jgi:mono/diheme cytochrome c family protein
MRLSRLALLALPVLFLAVVVLHAAQGSKVLDGKQIFLDQKCNMCHGVSSAEIEATTKSERMKGPDLTGLLAERDAKELASILRKNANMKSGKPHPKAFTGSDEEMGAMLAWLQSQEKK